MAPQGTFPAGSNSTTSASNSSSTGLPSNGTAIISNSTALPSATATHASTSKGLSTGAKAGVGVGAGLGGILLVLIAVFILLKRNKRSRSPQTKYAKESNGSRPKGYMDKPIVAVSNVTAKDDLPLERADDSQLRKHMQDLNELIHQHVENHYLGGNFQGLPENLKRELANCGYGDKTDPSAQVLSTLLIAPATRSTAIRQLIASVILHHIELKGDAKTSLLPGHIAEHCEATLRVKRSPAEEEAFSKWRHHNASLLVSNSSANSDNETLVSDASLQPGVKRNVQLLQSVLQDFINPEAEKQRAQSDNLSSIILEGAHFGVLLFCQPSLWVFGWESKGGTGGQRPKKDIIVFPSLEEVIVRSGKEHLRVVVDAVKEEI